MVVTYLVTVADVPIPRVDEAAEVTGGSNDEVPDGPAEESDSKEYEVEMELGKV